MNRLNSIEKRIIPQHTILLLGLLLFFLLYVSTYEKDVGWGGDWIQYVEQTMSLHDGKIDELMNRSTYRYRNSLPESPIVYPWGFSLLLYPAYALFGFNIIALRVFMTTLFILCLGLVFLLFQDKLPYYQNIILVFIFASNPYFFSFNDSILSETPFLIFTILSLILVDYVVIKKRVLVNHYASYLLIGVAIFYSYFIKLSGILLLPLLASSILIENYSNNKKYFLDNIYRKRGILLLPFLLFILFELACKIIFPMSLEPYIAKDRLQVTPTSILGNFIYYLITVPLSLFQSTIMPPESIYIAVSIFFIIGVIHRKKQDYIYHLFTLLYLTLIVIWPLRQGIRYLMPVVPFYLYFSMQGLSSTLSYFRDFVGESGKKNIMLLFGTALIAHSLIMVYYNNPAKEVVQGPYMPECRQLFEYIIINTHVEDVIVFSEPRTMVFFTNRTSIRQVDFEPIMKSEARYAVWYNTNDQHNIKLGKTIQEHPEKFKQVFENRKFKLFLILR